MHLPVRKALNKLSRMSFDEFRTRLSQELGKRAEYALHQIGLRAPSGISPHSSEPGRFFFSPDEIPGRVALLKEHLPSAITETVTEADEIMAHRFRLLGYRDLDYGSEIDWHLDAVHRKRTPLKPWYKIHFLDFDEVGDHKVTWELNRHQHLVTLAKASLFTGDDKYVEELTRQFHSWRTANPYPMGINWGSSLEVAFRSLSWLWVRSLLAKNPNLNGQFDRDMLQSLALNGRYIERYLSTYFSPNTHLIGEGVALFFIGMLCPQIPGARRWQRKGLKIVLAEAQRQVRTDGVYFEQSLYYHVYALDFFLYTRVLAACNRIEVSESFDSVLKKMLEVVRVLSLNGPPPGFGDDDGGRLFNPRRNRVKHLSDPLAIGATLFGSEQFRFTNVTEEAIWLFGKSAVVAAADQQQLISSTAFEDGGLYIIASRGQRATQMLIDAGPHGIGQSGHGHGDALSLQLSMDGRQWLVDPGSHVYVSSQNRPNERNQFRGTAAHNTVRIDQLDQAVPEGPFSWSSLPEVRVEEWITSFEFTFFSGSHNGYRRLPDPVLHRRMIFYLHGEYWLVRDLALGNKDHEIEVFWHFAPGFCASSTENCLTATSEEEKLVLLSASSGWSATVKEGSVSPVYGEQQPASVGVFKTRLPLPAEHATLVLPLHSADAIGRFQKMGTTPSQGVTGYIYTEGEVDDSIIFGDGQPWSIGAFRSDATLLFSRREAGEISSLIFCSARFVEFDGRLVFAAPQAAACIEWILGAPTPAAKPQSLEFFDEGALRHGTPVR